MNDLLKYGINNNNETNLEILKDYGENKVYSFKSNYTQENINKMNMYIYNNKLYCKGDKLIWGNVPGVLEGFYCGENEGIEIKQSKPENPCY